MPSSPLRLTARDIAISSFQRRKSHLYEPLPYDSLRFCTMLKGYAGDQGVWEKGEEWREKL